MSAVSAAVAPTPHRARRGFLGLRLSRSVLDIALAVVAIFWLVPTIGLTIISLRPERFFQQSGWWTVLGAPAQLNLQNYATLFSQGLVAGGVLDSLTTSIAITVPATLLVAIISSLAAYSLVFGRWRGREAVFLAVVALLVVPVQVALIPHTRRATTLGAARLGARVHLEADLVGKYVRQLMQPHRATRRRR